MSERFVCVSDANALDAARIHASSWCDAHRTFCSAAFVAQHTPQRQAEYLQNEMVQGKRIWMLEADGKPVGLVSVMGSLIENLYVDPERQRQGYGSKLLQYAMAQCEDAPRLWILSNNADAERLYARHGFLRTGRQKQLSDTLSEIEMAWQR